MGEHFFIGDDLQPNIAIEAIRRLLAHPDELVRAAAQQAIGEAMSVQPLPETDTEEETVTPSDGDWEKASAEAISEESVELQVAEEPAPTETQEEHKADIVPENPAKVIQTVMTFGDQAVFDLVEARGDVTQEFAGILSQYPHVNQAFRLGRLAIFHGEPDTSAIAKVVITNDGA